MTARRRTGSFVVCVAVAALALVGLAVVPASALPCETCPDPGGGGGTTYGHTAQLTITRPTAGTVTSNSVGGHAIDCGTVCSVSDSQTTADSTWPVDGWPTYTLSISGPAGYTARWFTCASADGTTCSGVETQACATSNVGQCEVVNDLEGKRVRVSLADETPPSTPTITVPPKVGPSLRHATASSSDSSGSLVSYRWYVDGVDQGLQSAFVGFDVPVTGLAEGAHTVRARARDAAGNESPLSNEATVVVDRSVRETVATVPDYVRAAPTLTFESTDADLAGFACSVDGAAFSPCASPWSPTLGDGSHTVGVRATDDVGNTVTVTRTFVIAPMQAPRASLRAPSRARAGSRVTLRLTVSGSAGPATGAVTWKVGRKVVCRTRLVGGASSCRTPRLRPGRQVVVATYAGSAAYTAASARRTISVRR